MSDLYLLNVTILDAQTQALQPLYQIEEELQSAIVFKDKSLAEIKKCISLIRSLREFPMDKFGLRQHRRILVILKDLSKNLFDIPLDHPIRHEFDKLKKTCFVQFRKYKISQGVLHTTELWDDVEEFKAVLRKMPLKLCYIATEKTLHQLRKKELTPEQQYTFNRCREIQTPEEFDELTNIRSIVTTELRELFVKKVIKNLFDELYKLDIYIATIFEEYVPIPDAWAWTLLSQVTMKKVTIADDVLSLSDATATTVIENNSPHCSPQRSASPIIVASELVAEDEAVELKEFCSVHAERLSKSLLDRLGQFIEHTYKSHLVNPNAERVVPTIDHFFQYHQKQSTNFSTTLEDNVPEQKSVTVSLFDKSTVEFESEEIRLKREKSLNTQVTNAINPTSMSMSVEPTEINHTKSPESEQAQNACSIPIKSEPLSQSAWSQDVEIVEVDSSGIILIDDYAETTQDLIDNLMTPGMGQMVSDGKDLLQNLVSTQTSVDDIRSPLVSPEVIAPTLESHEDIHSPLVSPEHVTPQLESRSDLVASQSKSPEHVSAPLDSPDQVGSPLELPEHVIAPLELAEHVIAQLESPELFLTPDEPTEQIQAGTENHSECATTLADDISVPPNESSKEVSGKTTTTNKRQQFFENPLEKTQIIRHTFAPLKVDVKDTGLAGDVPARPQTARRGRRKSVGRSGFVTKRRFKPTEVDIEPNIEDASMCVNPTSSADKLDVSVSDESQREPHPKGTRGGILVQVSYQTTAHIENDSNSTNNLIAIPIDQMSLHPVSSSSFSAVILANTLQPIINRQYFLKFANIKNATLTWQGGQLNSYVRFDGRFADDNLDTESTRLLLQMSADKQWSALCALFKNMSSFTFSADEPGSRNMRRSIVDQLLCALFKTRNYVRDGLVIAQDTVAENESRILRFVELNEPTKCLDKALSAEILENLKRHRCALKRKHFA